MSPYSYSPVAKGINKGVSKEPNLQEYNKEVNPPLILWDTMVSGLLCLEILSESGNSPTSHAFRVLTNNCRLPEESQKQDT
jgi:hypothetical protein